MTYKTKKFKPFQCILCGGTVVLKAEPGRKRMVKWKVYKEIPAEYYMSLGYSEQLTKIMNEDDD